MKQETKDEVTLDEEVAGEDPDQQQEYDDNYEAFDQTGNEDSIGYEDEEAPGPSDIGKGRFIFTNSSMKYKFDHLDGHC